jgi:poly(glycerol-phosphate) alpha-glucosyltransferase
VDVVALRDEFTDADASRWLPLKPKMGEVMGPRGFGFSPGMGEAMSSGVDVGYCAALWKYPAWAFLDWQKRTGKPAVVAPHGSLDAWALQNSKWKKRIAAAIFKDRQLRNATCFRALCSAEVDSIRAYGLKQRIEIVPNGVFLPEKLTTEGKEGKKRLLFLGRIHPKKGLVGALRAWADIQNPKSKIQNSKQWQFVIAGWDQGGHENELNALCRELGLKVFSCQDSVFSREDADVVFQGPAFGEEKEALLRSAAAFVLPSLSEGLPMSVLEAWAYGLPVVMTPECNLPEGFASSAALEIRNGGIGNAEWDGLRSLLYMSDSDRIEMGRLGRRLVEEKFTWPKVAAQMKALYEEILGS